VNAKQIITCIIVGFICLVIGAVISGLGIYFYTEKRIEKLNNIINETNEHFNETQKRLSDSIRTNNELRKQIEDSLIDTGKLKSITITSQSGIDDIITINNEIRKYIEGVISSK
jgi:hypothetical protein